MAPLHNPFSVKLAQPALRALANAGIVSLQSLSSWTQEEVAQLHGIGKNAIVQLEMALAEKGLDFAPEKE